jgi:exosome complex component RRP4
MLEENEAPAEQRILVIPGEVLGDSSFKPGTGTYQKGDRIFATHLGIKNIRAGYINVIPLAGKYMPRQGDSIIGIIKDVGPSSWIVNVNSPYPALMHVNDVPWKVDFGKTSQFLRAGDTVLAKIGQVDETMRTQVTLKEPGLRRLDRGHITAISPSKVPRVIGKGGSMISLVKVYTGCKIFVGQNGIIWLDGDAEGIINATKAIGMIDRDAQMMGLTDKVRQFLIERYGSEPRPRAPEELDAEEWE